MLYLLVLKCDIRSGLSATVLKKFVLYFMVHVSAIYYQ